MPFVPGTAALPTSEVELTISCRSLRGKDVLSKSDPMVVVYCNPFGEKKWVEFGRTEVIVNSHDPDFTKKFVMPYRFEEQQPLLFKVYDVDSSSSNLENHDYLGAASCSLAQIISSGKVQLGLSKHLSHEGVRGNIILSAEELSQVKDDVWLQFQGKHLDKKNFLGKSDPFLVFMKVMESGDFNVVHKTEVIKGTVDPTWQRFSIPVRILCNGDHERTIKVVCYDWNSSGDNELIGEFETSLKDLSQGPGTDTTYQLINRKKQKKKDSYKNSGSIYLTYFEIQKTYSFLDYIKGGTQIHCSFAIDFTGSNGEPTSPHSLHYIGTTPNSYEIAIQSVGNIIKDYDSDQAFPVLGFGACIPPHGVVSHEFFVNLTADNPYCKGIDGVLAAYRNCIMQVQLYGPTNFSPVINHVAKFAMTYRDGTNYFILLIITDGVITDMPKTLQAIVSASALPMSIIIVGVGPADFGAMEALDSDGTPLTAPNGSRAVRDIVQFVPLRNFMQPGVDHYTAMAKLAKEVLAEVPNQFISYMKANNVVPKPISSEM
ncbi:copine-8-like isoform X2 [Ischnura elegans]|uniref:copine-8-like isoform X2 n=1 Tax=Ischnura elegans TaxID=197161 RepID=UPI001ED884BD|nr:copine-8-like isoform X2 [Ischnura elegans]